MNETVVDTLTSKNRFDFRNIPRLKPSFLGKVIYHLFPIRKNIILGNIEHVYGAHAAFMEKKQLAQSLYGHLAHSICESLASLCMSKAAVRRKVRVEGQEFLYKAAEAKKGILLLTGHFGNWELVPIGGILHFEEFKGKFHVLRRELVNKTMEKILFGRFYRAGLNVIPKKNSLGKVLEVLGRNEVVAFIMDQYANPSKDGILVDFFGRKAGTFKSLAVIAGMTGAPVIPAICYREERGKHVMKFFEPLTWVSRDDPEDEIVANTRQYNETLENLILSYPAMWLWAHKRWKAKP